MKRFLSLVLTAVISMGIVTTALAGADDAYFFGYVEDDLDTTTEMEDVESNISRMGYYTKIYTNPADTRFTTNRLNSSFLYFAGHGNRYELNTGEDSGICINALNGYKDINNSSFSRTELAILAACKTGNYSNRPTDCLAGTVWDNGANCVLAWTASPNASILADYTYRYSRYVRLGYTYIESAIKTREYLINKGAFDTSSVFKNILFGSINDTLPDVVDEFSSYGSDDPMDAYLDEELNQHVIAKTVEYVADSANYDSIVDYIKENFDVDFNINDYKVTEYGVAENGVNSIAFRLKINGLSSNYGFSIICIDDYAKLINFTDTYDNYTAEELATTPVNMSEYNDDELFDMAINADALDSSVDEQYIEKYFDAEKGTVVYEVNTVYVDENGRYFCTVNVY